MINISSGFGVRCAIIKRQQYNSKYLKPLACVLYKNDSYQGSPGRTIVEDERDLSKSWQSGSMES